MAIISDGNNRTGDELSDKHVTVGTVEHTGSYVVSGTSGNQLLVNTSSMSVQYAIAPGGYATTVSPNIGVFENANGSQPTISVYRADDTKAYGGSFGLARSSSTGSVGSGDSLGSLSAAGYDGTRMNMAAEVAFAVDGTVSTDQMPGRIEFRVNPGDGSTVMPGRAMVIKSDGKVGIGTGTPSDDLHVVGTSKFQGNTFVTGSVNVTGSAQIKSNALVNQKAIQFDGLTPFDEIIISDATTATSFSSGGGTDKPLTISMWVNLEEIDYDGTNGKHQGALYSKRSTSPNDGEIYIGVNGGLLSFILYADPDQNGVGSFSTSNRLIAAQTSANSKFFHAENTWFHLCITYDGSKATSGIRIYKNSHPVGNGSIYEGGGGSSINNDLNVPSLIYFTTQASTNYSGTPQTSIPTTLGGIDVVDSSGNALAGKLADVCRFNRVLTPTEVQELYNDGNVKNMEEHSAYSDLVHWWKMGDHIDTTGQDGIKDYVGGYHGTLSGDASIVSETTLGSDVLSTVHFNTSGSVGIGTSNPAVELDVKGNSKFLGDVKVDGKVGIGTTTPLTELDVSGDVTVSGEITAATQPAFLARKPSNNQDSFAINTGVDVTLSTEDFDVGSNFASNTFTAPTTGVYIFTANVYLTNLDTDADSYSLDLVTTPGTYRLAIVDPGAFSADMGEYTLNGSMPLLLTEGDTAKIQVYQSGGSQQTSIRGSGTRGTFFAGYLLG